MVKKEKKRGGLLTGWLIFMLIANFFTGLFYLIFNSAVALGYPNWIFYIYGLLSLVNGIFLNKEVNYSFKSCLPVKVRIFFLFSKLISIKLLIIKSFPAK